MSSSASAAGRLRLGPRALALSPLVVAGASADEEGEGSPRGERALMVPRGCSPPAALPFEVDAVLLTLPPLLLVELLSREGRDGGVRTLEQRCLLTKQESQRWRLLLTMQIGLLREMQLLHLSSPLKVWSL